MRKHNFLKAVALTLCLALFASGTAFAATPGQALDAKEVNYGTLSRADQNILKSMFNAEEYAAMNEDVVKAVGKDANKLFAHFIKYGVFEGRGPSKSFNVSAYMSSYGDLQKAFGKDIMAYYRHYNNYGKKEKRDLVTVEKAEAAGVVIKSVTGATKTVLPPSVQNPSSGASAGSSSSSGSSSPVHAPVLNVRPSDTSLNETDDTTGITINVAWTSADVSGNTIAWSTQSSLVSLSGETTDTVTVKATDDRDDKIDTDTTIAISVTVDGTYTSTIDITMVNEGAAAQSNACAITAFSFASPSASGTIDEANKTIAVTVPHGTNVSNLVATFTASAGATVKVGSDDQTSGTTENDFTNPVSYVVTAEDTTTTATYTVTVTVAPAAVSNACAITAFSFASPSVSGTIDEANKTIAVTVPNGTDVSNLVATFTASAGATVKVGSDDQTSGTTENDFTNPVSYVVTAEDTTTTATYTVTVTIES